MENVTITTPKTEIIENLGYVVTVTTTANGIIARGMKQGPKIKNPAFNYRFSTEQRMFEYLFNFFANVQTRINEKAKIASIKSEARKNFVNPFLVGSVLYDSWGYEQTNIDFYQVMEVKGKSVVVRRISNELIGSEGYGSMAGKVKPRLNDFIGEPETKIVQIRCYRDEAKYSLASKFGSLSAYTSGDNGVYCSWGY